MSEPAAGVPASNPHAPTHLPARHRGVPVTRSRSSPPAATPPSSPATPCPAAEHHPAPPTSAGSVPEHGAIAFPTGRRRRRRARRPGRRLRPGRRGVRAGARPAVTGDGRLFRPGMQTMSLPRAAAAGDHASGRSPRPASSACWRSPRPRGCSPNRCRSTPPNTQVADAPTTVVDLQADGRSSPTRPTALGFVPDGQGDPDKELTPERASTCCASSTPRRTCRRPSAPTSSARTECGSRRRTGSRRGRLPTRRRPRSTDEPQPTVVPWPAGTGVRLADASTCAIGSGEVLAADARGSDHADVLHRGRRHLPGERGRSTPGHLLRLISRPMGELWESARASWRR